MPTGDPWWGMNTTWTGNYVQPIYTSAGSTQMQIYPAMVAVPTAEPEPEDDSPLAWLRGQVAEITELAQAA